MFVIQEFGVIEIGTFDKSRGPLRNREEFFNGGLPTLALKTLVAFPQCLGDNHGSWFPLLPEKWPPPSGELQDL